MPKVEFIKAFENGLWETEVIQVPDDELEHGPGTWEFETEVMKWALENLWGQTQYRDVVYWGVYNSSPEEEDETEDTVAQRAEEAQAEEGPAEES